MGASNKQKKAQYQQETVGWQSDTSRTLVAPRIPTCCPRCASKQIMVEELRDGTDFVCLPCGWRLITMQRSAFWKRVRAEAIIRGDVELTDLSMASDMQENPPRYSRERVSYEDDETDDD